MSRLMPSSHEAAAETAGRSLQEARDGRYEIEEA
jgi:hypothetical protein